MLRGCDSVVPCAAFVSAAFCCQGFVISVNLIQLDASWDFDFSVSDEWLAFALVICELSQSSHLRRLYVCLLRSELQHTIPQVTGTILRRTLHPLSNLVPAGTNDTSFGIFFAFLAQNHTLMPPHTPQRRSHHAARSTAHRAAHSVAHSAAHTALHAALTLEHVLHCRPAKAWSCCCGF